ncbi:MAG: hypothetical protein EHM20_12175 [Alphaproteobacteria bacterium]|nr:MAG: hypothetical protein EHM20_12175 [Alphaproteobacteria bacterium]
MEKNKIVAKLFLTALLALTLTGCKSDKKQKAAEEAAAARAEVVKVKAENVQLKSQISYLNEKLAVANQARDNIQDKFNKLIEDINMSATGTQDIEDENIKLRKLLAEQLKKSKETEKQIEMLKTAVNELQTKIEQQKLIQNQKPEPEDENSISK